MDRLRVLTLNIWNRMGDWDRRAVMIRRGLQRYEPALVGLQEVISDGQRSQADELALGLGYEHAFGSAHAFGGGIDLGNALLSRWPIREHAALPLPVEPGDEGRSLLYALVDAPYGPLPVFVTHLSWRFHQGLIREQQVLAIDELVRARAPIRGLPPVLVGDFNAAPEAAEIRFLTGLQSLSGRSTYFADCFGIEGTGPGATFDAKHNPYAAPTHEPLRRIDYVFVRGPDARGRGKPLSSEVVYREVEGEIAASDHYGVVADITIDELEG